MYFSVEALKTIKGTRLLHVKRNSTYRVIRVVKVKVDTYWVAGLEYRCEKTGEVYVRPTNKFTGFVEAPRRTFCQWLKSLAKWG